MPARSRPRVIRTALVGLGTVNRNLLRILATKRDRLAGDYGLAFRPVFLADSSGVAADDQGFDPTTPRAKGRFVVLRGRLKKSP